MSLQQAPRSVRVRKNFSEDEDDQLRQLVELHGDNNWLTIAQFMPGRDSRQCKERWNHYLSPNVRMEPWRPDEDDLLEMKVQEMGRKWKVMEVYFPGRTDINIKNRFNLLERRKRCEIRKAQKALQRRSTRYTMAPIPAQMPKEPAGEESDFWNDLLDDNFEMLFGTDGNSSLFWL